LTLAAGGNTATLTLVAVESVIGGSGDDIITLGTALSSETLVFNGTAGSDSLTLAAGGNTATLTLTAVESVIGGAGIDTITLTSTTGVNVNLAESGTAAADVLTGTAAIDTISAGNGDKIVYLSGSITEGAAPTSGTTNLTTAGDVDVITKPASGTLLLDLAAVGNTIANNPSLTIGTTLMVGATANELTVTTGTYSAGVFTNTATNPTHTLVQYDTSADTTAGGVGNILIVGTFTSAAVSSEILTLTV
jgi:hypothetical protein